MDNDNAQRIEAAVRELSDTEKAKIVTLLGQLSNPACNVIMQVAPGQNHILNADGQRLLLWAQAALAAAFNMNAEKLIQHIKQSRH